MRRMAGEQDAEIDPANVHSSVVNHRPFRIPEFAEHMFVRMSSVRSVRRRDVSEKMQRAVLSQKSSPPNQEQRME